MEYSNKPVCRKCRTLLTVGIKKCPNCGKTRLLPKHEMQRLGMKVHQDWDDDYFQIKENTSDGRGDSITAQFSIDSGELWYEEEN